MLSVSSLIPLLVIVGSGNKPNGNGRKCCRHSPIALFYVSFMSIDPARWKKKPVGVILSVTYLRVISVTSKRYFLDLPSSPPHYQHAPVASAEESHCEEIAFSDSTYANPAPYPESDQERICRDIRETSCAFREIICRSFLTWLELV